MYSKKLVFLSACAGMLLFGISMITLGSVLPSVTSTFNLDGIAAGILALLLPLGILIGSLLFGPIVDQYGFKPLLIVSSLCVFVSLEILAFSESYFFVQTSIFIIGIGGGILNGATNALVADISTNGKSANLSILGVFYGIGALGMPAILGAFPGISSNETILSTVGLFVLLPVLFFIVIRFPEPKQPQNFSFKQSFSLFKNPVLLLLGFFLFFQSGVEGLVNNWTTSFLIDKFNESQDDALFTLSLFVLSLTITRLLLGAVLKKVKPSVVLITCIVVALLGSILIWYSSSLHTATTGFVLLGIGLASGFPVILGYVGDFFAELSGTAFSIVLVIALIGNMIINYLIGFFAYIYEISILSFILFICLVSMLILFQFATKLISRKL